MDDLLELDEQILAFDIPDEALERAGNDEQSYTLAYCTHPWQCPWPSVSATTPAASLYSPRSAALRLS
jgi:hypothetical protein